jgi:YVTN family beta-propeller protein
MISPARRFSIAALLLMVAAAPLGAVRQDPESVPLVPPSASISFTGAEITAMGVYEKTEKIYLADDNSESILVVDGKTNQRIATIAGIGGSVFEIAVNEKYGKVYAFSEKNCCTTGLTPGNGKLSVIDAATDKVLKTMTLESGLVLSYVRLLNDPVRDRVYVGDQGGLGIIDPSTDVLTRVSGAPSIHPWIDKLALNTVTSEVFYPTSTVELIAVDVKNLTFQRVRYPTGASQTLSIAANERENKVYLTLIQIPGQAYMGIAILDRKTGGFRYVGRNDLEPLAFNNTSNRLFSGVQVGDYNGAIVDGATDQLAQVDIGTNGISDVDVNESTDRAYLVSNKTVVVDGATKSTLAQVNTPGWFVTVNRTNGKVYVADTEKLTVLDDTILPGLDITMSKSAYADGDTITATEFRIRNPLTAATKAHLKAWLKVPTVGDVTFIDVGADGTFSLPPSVDVNLGPFSLLQVAPGFPPKGEWELDSRIENPASGARYSEDINKFSVK